jgi:hypothetical protein
MADETSPEKQARDDGEFVKLWFDRIDAQLNADAQKAWREEADRCEKRYSLEKNAPANDKRFNIFFANVETIGAAAYNSTPTPDVRRRFGDPDPAGKMASDVIERALASAVDLYDFDDVMTGVVHDGEVVGIGLSRVRFDTKFANPQMGHNGGPPLTEDAANTATDAQEPPAESDAAQAPQPVIAWQSVWCEKVDWADFVSGPASEWGGQEWIAFRHRMDREGIAAINPRIADVIELSGWEGGADSRKRPRKADEARDAKLKRGEVWEIWYKPQLQVIYIARDYPQEALATKPDPMGFREFWPMPRPYAPISKPHDMTPVPSYRIYATQAQELAEISRRITKLTAALRWRGIYASEFAAAFKEMESLDDGNMAPVKDAMTWKDKGLDAAIWTMPIDKAIGVLKELHADREQVKQVIYELTGIADIMRGSSQASETLGAQKLKTQWGSLRIQRRQKAVQRYARDLFRLKSEIIGKKFTPQVLQLQTGLDLAPAPVPPPQPLPPQAAQDPAAMEQAKQQNEAFEGFMAATGALKLIRGDMEREYRIDIETDSTVQADVQQAQQNAGLFLQGLAGFTTAVTPLVQSGAMMMDEAVDILTALARPFKLGRQAEDALERMGRRAQEQKGQPQEKPPTPEQIQGQKDQAELQLKAQDQQATHQREMQKLGFEQQKHVDTMAHQDKKLATETTLKQQQMQIDDARQREQMHRDHEIKREGMIMQDSQKREEMGRKSASDAADRQHMSKIDDVADDAHGRTAKEVSGLMKDLAPALESIGEGLAKLGEGQQAQAHATSQLAQAAMAETELVRGPDGRAAGARKKSVQPQVN